MNYFGNGEFVWIVNYYRYGVWILDSWVYAHIDAFNWGGK